MEQIRAQIGIKWRRCVKAVEHINLILNGYSKPIRQHLTFCSKLIALGGEWY